MKIARATTMLASTAAAALGWHASAARAQLLAFPGAEGFGAYAAGGRGGDVYHVTSLADTNTPGTLRYGCNNAPAAGRTIVFDISGTIDMASDFTISKSKITVAGQTAPGSGIMFRGYQTTIGGSDIIMRYVRFRPGDEHGPLKQAAPNFQGDSLDTRNARNCIIDHVSTAWSIDENLSATWSDNITIQNSIIGEALKNAGHDNGSGGVEAHSYGSLFGYTDSTWLGRLSVHHNLYISNDSRNPRVGDNTQVDFVNNVLYNWGGRCGYSGGATEGTPKLNYVGNYLIAGPSTTSGHVAEAFYGGSTNTQIYQSDNVIDSDKDALRDGTNTGWSMFTGSYTQMATPFAYPALTTDSAATAYDKVLAQAGASYARDGVDARLVGNVINTSGVIIDSQDQVGGYPSIPIVTRPAGFDSDNDGMPNTWEAARGLNPSLANNNVAGPNGYTNLENYLNDLALVANWNVNGNAAWSAYGSWVGTTPNGADATATFGPIITAPRTITVDAPRIVGQINFDSGAAGYTIAGSSPLTLSVISGYSTIDVLSGNHTISTPLNLGNDLVTTVAGSSTLSLSNLQPNSKAITKLGGGKLIVNNVRATSLTVSAGVVQVAPNGSATAASKLATLSVATGAKLDISDNKLIITGMGVGGWNGSAYTGVTGLIASGYSASQDFSGFGIVTTQSNATGGNTMTCIGVASNADLGLATFGGMNVGAADTLVMYTYGGDANLDGAITGDDYFQIDSAFPQGLHGWFNGDFNYDGAITGDDYFVIDSNFPAQGSPLSGSVAATTALVPEPAPAASVAVAAAAAATGMTSLRRRRI